MRLDLPFSFTFVYVATALSWPLGIWDVSFLAWFFTLFPMVAVSFLYSNGKVSCLRYPTNVTREIERNSQERVRASLNRLENRTEVAGYPWRERV